MSQALKKGKISYRGEDLEVTS